MNVAVLGAGISGLTISRLLKKDGHEVVVYEKEDILGGIARPRVVNGIPYHTVGGHCFNSNNSNVLNYIFSKILPEEEWNLLDRTSKIYLNGNYISYPIEFSIKEIACFDKKLAFNMFRDLISNSGVQASNLYDWLIQTFGLTLAKEYFIPYNNKIWRRDLKQVSPSWVIGKLPVPNAEEVFESLIINKKDNMPHSTFYYPKSNSQSFFIDKLATDLTVIKNYTIEKIEKLNNKWILNGEKGYDIIISTIPLNELPYLIKESPTEIINAASKLCYNRVSTVLWESDITDRTWTYYPSGEYLFHRQIHIGNFVTPNKPYTITEVMGEVDFDKYIRNCKNSSFLINPIDHNLSNHAYVLFEKDTITNKQIIFNYLSSIGMYTLGRFGEWEYYNMDICIEKAICLSKRIMKEGEYERKI
ncbi:MAG TPA: nucleotidyl-sugar pyranose mutase [Candidatus Margulisbacteria bacterium]|nr:MAG: hypothetical protein A2X43_05855 [Candidatus Margulisbacteria bacterium GWD2_39_127]HCT84081.1 nucleotidyl-sugar pyranose mutase [Candidatus Margulisiibacteriota bacterium]